MVYRSIVFFRFMFRGFFILEFVILFVIINYCSYLILYIDSIIVYKGRI